MMLVLGVTRDLPCLRVLGGGCPLLGTAAPPRVVTETVGLMLTHA